MSRPCERVNDPRVDVIKSWFDYDRETGTIWWTDWIDDSWYKHEGLRNKFLQERAGRIVEFYFTQSGHMRIRAGGIDDIFAHLIAWVLEYGELPEHSIDHIDGDPTNNRIENLRDVPHKINMRNRKLSSANTSGFTGVYWHKEQQKWRSTVMTDQKRQHLGNFDTIEEAVEARRNFIDQNPQLGFTKTHGQPRNK